MPDLADVADSIQAEYLARGLARVTSAIPAGVAGECEECGEDMPRLVGGLCGFCRDGRRPPLSRFDPPTTPPQPKESIAMTSLKTPTSRVINVPVAGATLAAIERVAGIEGLPLGQTVRFMIEQSLAVEAAAPATLPLAEVHLDALLSELRSRFDLATDNSADVDAAVERAEAAEAKLAAIGAMFVAPSPVAPS